MIIYGEVNGTLNIMLYEHKKIFFYSVIIGF